MTTETDYETLVERLLGWKPQYRGDGDERPIPLAAKAAAAIQSLLARNAELEAEVARFREEVETISDPNKLLCCTGRECGCRGATVGQYTAWLMNSRAALESKEPG